MLKNYIVNDSVKSLNDIVSRFNFYLTKVKFLCDSVNFSGDAGFYNVLKWQKLNCEQQSSWAANVLNDCGIPTEIHFTPNWLNRIGGHSWCASRDKKGIYRAFSPQWQNLGDTLNFKRVSKVYKKSFEIQKESPALLKQVDELIPTGLSSPYIKDVSEQYHKVIDLKITCENLSKTNKLAYLAIFTSKGWKPVAWGNVDILNSKISFKKVPVKVTYIFGQYIKGSFKPEGSPFYINNKGQKKDFIANYNNTETMVLNEKYPQKDDLKKWLAPIINSRFTGANKSDFSDEITLYQLKKMPQPIVNEIEVNNKGKYKYVRFVTENNALSYLAILEFFKKINKNEPINIGTRPYITKIEDAKNINSFENYSKLNDISKGWKENDTRAKCLDGNIETFTNSRWVGLEFETPQTIEKIRFAFRTANNFINSKDVYKLSYYDNNWITFKIHKAQFNFLLFKNVLTNTIFWLSNLTKGNEELAFIYKDQKQLFLNHDDIEGYFKN